MDPSLSPLTKSVFTDLLETQTRLRDEAEHKWITARRFIQEIAGQVANEWLDEKQKSGMDIERIPLDVLTNVIRDRISRLASRNQPATEAAESKLRQKYQLLAENYRLAELKIAQLEDEKTNLVDTVKRLTANVEKLDEKSIDQNAPYYQPDLTSPPGFYLEWTQDKFFDRQSFVVQLIGETGLARAPELKKKIEEKFGLSKNSKSAADVIKDLAKSGFVDDYSTTGGLPGRPPDMIELTDLGQVVYKFLTGKKPVSSEFDIKKEHKTDAHTRLVLMAQDWLKKAGYEILEHAPVLQMDAHHVFNPDMVARRGEDVIYIEVERDSRKGNQDREAKWQNFFHFTRGRMYFFCENTNAQKTIIREVNVALGANLSQARIAICDLSQINANLLQTSGDIWTSIRSRAE